MKFFNQKGEGRGKFFFGLLVLLSIVYLAWKVVPVMIRVYAFDDAVKEECKYMRRRTLEELKKDIVDAAKVQDLDVTEGDISIDKFRSEEHQELKVRIDYVAPIVTPFYVYNWEQTILYQAPVFE